MDRPNSPQEWAAFYKAQNEKRAAVQAREDQAVAKQPATDLRMHPLLEPPNLPTGTPLEVWEHVQGSHQWHAAEAERAVQRHREGGAAEAERAAWDAFFAWGAARFSQPAGKPS
jgi:hypothetical protein